MLTVVLALVVDTSIIRTPPSNFPLFRGNEMDLSLRRTLTVILVLLFHSLLFPPFRFVFFFSFIFLTPTLFPRPNQDYLRKFQLSSPSSPVLQRVWRFTLRRRSLMCPPHEPTPPLPLRLSPPPLTALVRSPFFDSPECPRRLTRG